MPHVIKGSAVRTSWTVRDASFNPLSGLASPADVDFLLHRDSGAAMVASGEPISFAEVGASGTYTVSFTPASTGHYVLTLREKVGLRRITEFRYDVLQAGEGAVPTYANAYCAEVDIERWAQMQISATSAPSDSEVAAFAEARASELTGIAVSLGFEISPSTITAGSTEEDLFREANAIGGAADTVMAKFMSESPSRSDKAEALLAEYQKRVDRITNYIKRFKVSLATNHILSGDTDEPLAVSAPLNRGIEITMGSEF